MEGTKVFSSSLQHRFWSELLEAEGVSRHLQIIPRFRSIGMLIDSMGVGEGKAEVLTQAISALSECAVFAQKQGKEGGMNKGVRAMRGVVFEMKMRSRLDEIEGKIKNMSRHRRTESSGHAIQHTLSDLPNPNIPATTCRGFDSEATEIEKLLARREFMAIGIVGRCGCGKTALARKVLESSQAFAPRIFVPLSEMLNEESSDARVTILNHILKGKGTVPGTETELDDYSVVKLLERLQLRLMEKRYLIVLDDAWRMDEWLADLPGKGRPTAESFTHGLPKGSGGAVIVTSRSESVIRGMVGEKHVIRPHLSDEICWEVFTHAVRQLELIHPDHPTLVRMKYFITRNCAGLPLAAITLANVISKLISDSSS